MAQTKVKFSETKDVTEYVHAAEKCDFDIDITYNHMIMDAKSILGILSLGLEKMFTVNCHGENPEFFREIQKFAVA